MSIGAKHWNELGRALRRARVIQGRDARVARLGMGQVVSAQGTDKWQHPWTISASWAEGSNGVSGGGWNVSVRAGFVNGRAPVMETAVSETPAATLARMAALNAVAGTGTVRAPLYDGPMVSLAWMAMGSDGNAGDPAPQFFQDRGVSAAAPVSDDLGETQTATVPPGTRLLRKCDVVLHQPRYGLQANVSVGDGIATGQATTTVTLTLTPIDPTDALRVYAISQWVTAEGQPDPTTGTYVEPTYDEMVIGTVYALSEPDAAPYSDPDGTWEIYVAHNLFWNLSYAQPQFTPVATDIGDPLLVPLAGGAAQSIINEFTSLEADAMSEALSFIGQQSMQGTFWTATGGGSDSRFPAAAAPAAAGTTGLDKDGRLEAQRAQAQAAVAAEQLDPDFPYYSPSFNLNLLNP